MTLRIAVLGAGTMGAGIASVFASVGNEVSLYSRSQDTLDDARAAISERTVTYTTSVAECVADAEVICETVVESLAVKRDLFAELESLAPPDCLLTTNTSSIPITSIASVLRRPERLVGLHWFNPPPVMPLVEVIRGERTDDGVVAHTREICSGAGKQVIEVCQDVPGFVVNRLQYALFREAVHLVEQGIASIDDVDRAVSTTLAPRWSACGPLRLMDLAGLDTVEKVAATILPSLNVQSVVPDAVSQRVSRGEYGTKTGRGFYEWTPEEIASTTRRRDAIVELLTREGR